MREIFQNLFGIQDRSYNKFELIIPLSHERLDHLGRIPNRLMLAHPLVACISQGIRVAEFRADRPEIARDWSVDRPGSFDRHMLATHFEFSAQIGQGIEYHRFATGDDDVFDAKVLDLF